MSWHYAYTPHIWPSFCTVLLMLALATYSWRRRNMPGTLPFAIYCLLGVPLLASKIMAYLAVDFETKVFWFKIENAWWLPVSTAMTCFILEYTQPGRWLTRRNLTLLSIAPLLTLVFLVTNDFHHLSFLGFGFNGSVVPIYGPVGWIIFVYVFVLSLLNIIVFAWLFVRSPQHRWPVILILTTQIFVRVLVLLDPVIREFWFFYVPEVAFTVVACAIAMFGFHIFDPIPLARQALIAQMREGVLVLDPQGRVVSLNPSAQATLGVLGKRALGRPVQNLLPEYAYVAGDPPVTGVDRVEISRGTGPETRDYVLATSTLKDWRGLAVGRLLLLHDVTEQKKAQAQLIEQQRALAILQEHERLVRELHDSIGQVLGYAGFQVEAATKLVLDGHVDAATTQLDRLAEVIRDAHADVREYILDLHAAPAPQQPLFAALRHYLEGFTHNYNIQTQLSVDERLGDDPFPSDARMQVFRILQEALSNARKHSRARSVQVTFAVEDQIVCMTVKDDGDGFDPTQSATGGDGHFGLQFMRERAETLGGCLEVISKPGQGTLVVARAPMRTIRSTRENEVNDARFSVS